MSKNHVCVKSNFDTIRNTPVKSMTGPIILLSYFLLYTMALCIQKYYIRTTRRHHIHYLKLISNLKIKLVAAIVSVMLLCFQPIAIVAFSLLHCTSIEEEQVLRIDAAVSCFQTWQYLVIVFVHCFHFILPLSQITCKLTGHHQVTSYRVPCFR